jgi:hypothetical protein
MVIVGILLGVYSGWRKMLQQSKKIDDQAAEAMRRRRGL